MKKYLFLFITLYIFFFFALVQMTSPVYAGYACNANCSQDKSGCNQNGVRSCYNISGVGWRCRADDCIDQIDCACDYPNCKNMIGSATAVKGNTYTYSAAYENYYGPLTRAGMVFRTNCSTAPEAAPTTAEPVPTGSYSFDWTPTTPGTYTVYCDAWNDGIAECMGDCGNDTLNNPYTCPGPTAKMAVTVVTPTPYPTVAVSGNLREYLGAACYPDISTNTLSLNINPQIPAGVTTNCGVTPPTGQTRSSYRCTVVFDNQAPYPTPTPNPAQNLNLSASATGYSAAYWTDDDPYLSDVVCRDTVSNSLLVDVSSGDSTVYSKDIFFKNISSWTKIKNSSFSSPASLTNVIPLNIAAYDGDDDVSQRYFIMTSIDNDPGLVSASSIDTGTADVSSKNWKADYDYPHQTALTPLLFTQYVKSRKEYQTIDQTQPDPLGQLSETKINLWEGNLTLNNAAKFNNKKVVLIVNGTLTLSMENFKPSNNASVAFVAQTINFYEGTTFVKEAEGLFIAQAVNTGSTSNQGLKIKGNLVAQSPLNNNRNWSDNSQPSVFIVFDPEQYINLLPYLSTASYDWRQIQ